MESFFVKILTATAAALLEALVVRLARILLEALRGARAATPAAA